MNLDAHSFGLRLKNEREKLGLSQKEAADFCGVRREMWGKYERGDAEPGARVLERFSTHDADVLFVLTGRREPKLEENEGFINSVTMGLIVVDLVDRLTREGITPDDYSLSIEGWDAARLKADSESRYIGRLVSLAGAIYNDLLAVPVDERSNTAKQWAHGVALSERLRLRERPSSVAP